MQQITFEQHVRDMYFFSGGWETPWDQKVTLLLPSLGHGCVSRVYDMNNGKALKIATKIDGTFHFLNKCLAARMSGEVQSWMPVVYSVNIIYNDETGEYDGYTAVTERLDATARALDLDRQDDVFSKLVSGVCDFMGWSCIELDMHEDNVMWSDARACWVVIDPAYQTND